MARVASMLVLDMIGDAARGAWNPQFSSAFPEFDIEVLWAAGAPPYR
jgi:hypothetical protein